MNLILFDGVCNLCNGFVNFIIDQDKNEQFKFASLQSDYAKELMDSDSGKLDSVIYFDGTHFFKKSDAVFQIAKQLPKFKWVAVFSFLPRFFLDTLYDLVAKNRYKVFGKRNTCRIPSAKLRNRFLD
jgi:predicted DCC family thiol-disulfide oxidoreductase YuxK